MRGSDMVVWVKTTIDIADGLLVEAKRLAAERGMTLRELVEEALRATTAKARGQKRRRFRLRDESFRGQGLQPGLSWGDWESLRDLVYEGRGG